MLYKLDISNHGDYLKFLHLNAQSARNKYDELTLFFDAFSFNFDVIMLSETWYKYADDVLSVPGYQTFFLNRPTRRGGGVLQLVSNELSCTMLPEFCLIAPDYEVLSVQCKKYVFVVLYRPPNGNIDACLLFLERLLSFICLNDLYLAIGGDFNVNLLQNTKCARDLQLIFQSFHCRNVITTPTRLSSTSDSLLDLFITNCTIEDTKAGTIVADMGDHLPIYMFCPFSASSGGARHSKTFLVQEINYKTLSMFRNEIGNVDWTTVFHCNDPDRAYSTFLHILKGIYEKCFKFRTVQKCAKGRKPWLNNECAVMIRKKNLLYNNFVKTRDPCEFAAFKKYRNQVTKFLRHTKKVYFENLFSQISSRSDLLWREINQLLNRNNRQIAELELIHNHRVIKGVELADQFNDYFTRLEKSDFNIAATEFLGPRNAYTAFFAPTTSDEVFQTFMSLKNSKARDINGLQIRPIKFVADILSPALTHIFNLSICAGIFPQEMQCAKVSVIFKSGDRNVFSNYRPVSVLPVISKGLEKIICKRITAFCDKHSIITAQQYGFREGMSTELALLTQKELILNSFENKQFMLGIFVDYSKAFDRLNHRTLFTKLEHYGFRGTPLELIISYLKHRRQCVAIMSEQSTLQKITQGVPQGSILGPILFNIYINDITNISNDADFIVYADDTSIFLRSSDISTLSVISNSALKCLAEWSFVNSLKLNTAKTKAVLFTPPQRHDLKDFRLELGSARIELASNVKTLGVVFNNHLIWNDHVDHIATRLAKACGVLCRLRYTLPRSVKRMIYNALFSPHLTYCQLVWGDTTKVNLHRLSVLQKRAVRHIANVQYDANTGELFSTLKICPLENFYNVNLALKCQKYFRCNNHSFLLLCKLTIPKAISYNIRERDRWLIPFSRTKYGMSSLSYLVPRLLNEFERNGICIQRSSRSAIKRYVGEHLSSK